jgi:hypothetical protein
MVCVHVPLLLKRNGGGVLFGVLKSSQWCPRFLACYGSVSFWHPVVTFLLCYEALWRTTMNGIKVNALYIHTYIHTHKDRQTDLASRPGFWDMKSRGSGCSCIVGERVTHCNKGPAITHRRPTILISSQWTRPDPLRFLVRVARPQRTHGTYTQVDILSSACRKLPQMTRPRPRFHFFPIA